ncbi:GNAT family N-acetyltransferase [Pseudaeromonas paramecii]|uniref:N-acetyltransferase domain-containing protein n=1 Tax=Pseudaeromonas paramecii TaxID=2138166 RepID=A0ABP8QJP8_9GAMM
MHVPLPAGVGLRPLTDDDKAFMARLYALNRQAEVANFPFNEQQKKLFLHSQFEAQFRHYFSHYPRGRFALIEQQGTPIGRFLVAELPGQLRLVDIALLPSHQRLGIGSALIRQLQADARAQGLSIQLQVDPVSPARGLYERLGFMAGEGNGLYLAMVWAPRPLSPDEGGRLGGSTAT